MERTIIVHVALAMASYDGQGRPGAALVVSTSRPNAVNAITSCVKRPGNKLNGERKRGGDGRDLRYTLFGTRYRFIVCGSCTESIITRPANISLLGLGRGGRLRIECDDYSNSRCVVRERFKLVSGF